MFPEKKKKNEINEINMPMLLGTWLIVFPNLSKIEYLGGNMTDIFLSCFQFDFKF